MGYILLCEVNKRAVAYARGRIALRLKELLGKQSRKAVASAMGCSESYCNKLQRWAKAVQQFPFLLRAEISCRDALENVSFLLKCAEQYKKKEAK